MRSAIAPFAVRPRLSGSILLGLAAGLVLALVPNGLSWSTRAIFAWDLACGAFIFMSLRLMSECDVTRIRARAATQDEGQSLILLLTVAAAAASVGAIAAELSLAKADHGLLKSLRIILAFATVAGSWLFVQIMFALHYAHEYYADSPDGDARGGLAFPGNEPPDYWDFLHFAVVIGVAAQTADISFTSKDLRRIGTIQGVVSFAFNTVVLALTINLLAGVF